MFISKHNTICSFLNIICSLWFPSFHLTQNYVLGSRNFAELQEIKENSIMQNLAQFQSNSRLYISKFHKIHYLSNFNSVYLLSDIVKF